MLSFFFFQAEDGIRGLVRSRGLGDVYKRQAQARLTDEANGNREYTEAAERAQDPELKKMLLELSLIHI